MDPVTSPAVVDETNEEREYKINQYATQMARDYFVKKECKGEKKETSFQKVFLVFKFANTPQSMIDEAIEAMGDRNHARSYFKSIARMIHPDKNAHPLAS